MSKNILRQQVTDATAWKGEDLRHDDSWKYTLTPADIAEIDQAFQSVQRKGLRWGEFGKADFPLPEFSARLRAVDQQIRNGRGFMLLRGFPVEAYTLDQLKTIYWGLGVHMGQVISHNTKGDFVAPVTDLALKDNDPNRRNNTTTQLLDPHTDLADVVALLCVDKAKEGGLSSLCSSVTIHNEILRHHPEYLEPLYEGFHHDFRGYGPSGDPNEVTPTPIPVFEYNNGRINCAFVRKLIETGAAKRGVPLTALQKEAIDYVHDLALREDLRIDMMLEPGDIQIINNYITLHARTNYIDHESGPKRFLLRMWINLDNHVQLSPDFAAFVRRGIPAKRTDPQPQAVSA
jgi:hypothetical protein